MSYEETLCRGDAVMTSSGLAWPQAWNHDPSSPIGPLHWGTVTPSYATGGDSITGEVGMKQSPIDIVPDDVYQMVQFHFHAPSEHTINGVRYDAELHLVHTNVIGEAVAIGVLLSSSAAGLPIFDAIMADSPATPVHSQRRHARKACNGSLCKIQFPSRPAPWLNCIA